jgi:hypothetical protein
MRKVTLWHIAILFLLIGVIYWVVLRWELYRPYPWVDMPLHFLGGAFLGLIWLWLARPGFVFAQEFRASKLLATASLTGFVLLGGLAWELFEFSLWRFLPEYGNVLKIYQAPVSDVLSDLVLDFFGGMTALLLCLRSKRQQSPVVYCAGAVRDDRTMAEALREMVRFVQSLGIRVLSEHLGHENPILAFAHKIGHTGSEPPAHAIERQDTAWLDQATHVIAEISGASTGTGREIEYARTKGEFGKTPAKVLCLYHREREFHASPMVRGMTADRYANVSVRAYSDLEEMKAVIQEFLGR